MAAETAASSSPEQGTAGPGRVEDGWLPARVLEDHDAFFTLDREWRFSYLNRRAEQILQRPRAELLGETAWLACPQLRRGTFEHQLRRAARARERVAFEQFHAQRATWLEVVADPWAEGLAVWLRDVTERKRRERRDLYFRVAAAAISSAPDMHGAMAAFARSVAALTGWSYAETWAPGAPGGPLRCLEVVRFDRPGYAEFERTSRALVLEPGVGLVGRAFATRVPLLDADLPHRDSPRTAQGTAAGFTTGLALPVYAHDAAIGVVAFLSERGDDDDWFRVLEDHGQIELLFERHYAHEALRRSEERHRLLFEDGAAPMWIYDAQTLRFLAVNQRAIELYGFSREEFLGMSLREVRPPEEIPRLLEAHRQAGGGTWRAGIWLHRKKDGTPLPVSVSSHLLELDGRPERVAVITDMTEQQRAVARLREQATLLDSANDAIVVQDLAGAVTFWNRGAERVYGRPAAEALGRSFAQLTDPRGDAFDQAQAAVAEGGDWVGELTHDLGQGREVVVSTRWTSVSDEAGRPRAILSIGTDVTERKKLEAQFLRAQRMDTIGTLAGGIAHDLNNMLTPILLSVELLRGAQLDAEAREGLDTIEAAAQRGAAMVGQVLHFARGDADERRALRPSLLLKETARIATTSMPKSIEVHLDAPDELPWIEGDSTQLEQVLMNLSVNARDAMPEGGVLTLSGRTVLLEGAALAARPGATPGRYVALEVTDTGCGIAPELRERIFEPFFTTKTIGQGTGLGLATSRSIASSHHGFLDVHSEVGKGSTFQLFLPALRSQVTGAARTRAVATSPHGQAQLVLVVDDEPAIRSAARRTLQAQGYRTLEASNGAEALAAFARAGGAIELAIVDMSMPVMDGVATIRALRTLDPGGAVRIVAVSGLGINGAFAQAKAEGVTRFLEKPYTGAALLELVRQALADSPGAHPAPTNLV
jgi:PAS domain S-box-containing protein